MSAGSAAWNEAPSRVEFVGSLEKRNVSVYPLWNGLRYAQIAWNRHDLSNLSQTAQQQQVPQLFDDLKHSSFDLQAEWKIEVRLLKLGSDRHSPPLAS